MITWREKYIRYRASVAKGAIVLNATWDREGFEVNVNGRTLEKRFHSISEAKDAAVRPALKIIAEAQEELT